MSDTDCPICLSSLASGEHNTAMMCGHCYHTICLQTYAETMKTEVAQLRCAVCKRSNADIHPDHDVDVNAETNAGDHDVHGTPQRGPTVPRSWTLATSPADDDVDDVPVEVSSAELGNHEEAAAATIQMTSDAQADAREVDVGAAEPVSDMGAAGSDGPISGLKTT